MNNFGLGLILSFTDNATSGIQRATGAFNNLERTIDNIVSASNQNFLKNFSDAANETGRILQSIGERVVSTFTGAVSSIIDTGTSFDNARNQLTHLYGSLELGESVLDRIKQYAAKTVFGAEDLIPTVVMLKAHGIEAFDEIATSAYRATNGVQGYSQTILDYASDLAAFNPTMSNIYGKGIEAAMGAIKEYIAEGNAQFLKRGASLDINQLLGEETAKTAEERSRQIADLIEKMGMVGMTANLANTPMQKLANISDTFYNIVSDIASSGVMDMYSKLLSKISTYIAEIPKDELKNIARVISSALVELIQPLEVVLDFILQIVDKVRVLIRENPELVKTVIKIVAIAGVFSLITGIALRLLAALGNLKIALSGLFGKNILSAGFKLLGLLKSFLMYFGPIIAAVILLRSAWDRNFMGMQDTLRGFLRDTIDTFRIMFDAWGDYTLSEDNFERARELGLLPFIEAILQLKYHLGFLFKGMKAGFDAFFDQLGKILNKVGILDHETHGFRDLITSLLEKITAPGMTDNWEKIGYWIGNIGGWVLVVVAVLPVVLKIVSAILTVAKGIGSVVSFLSKAGVFAKIASVLPKIGSGLLTIGEIILGIITTPIVAIPLLIAAAIFGIYELIKHWDEVKEFIQKDIQLRLDIIKGLIHKFWVEVLKDTPVGNFIEQKVMPFVSKLIEVFLKVRSIISEVSNFIIGIFRKIYSVAYPIIEKIRGVFVTAFTKVLEIMGHVREAFEKFVYAVYEVVRVIRLAVQVVFKWIYEHIIQPVVDAISTAFTWVKGTIIDPVVDKISEKLTWLKEHIVEPVFNGIKNFVNDAVQAISDFVTPIIDAVSEAIAFLAEKINAAVDAVGNFFGNMGDYFKGIGDDLETMLGLSTGGYVKETGAAVLHPNEVVINDVLTQRLGKFLDDYSRNPLVAQDIVATDDYREMPQGTPAPRYVPTSPIQNYVNNTNSESSNSNVDNSVVFESGSIVFSIDKNTDLANMSEAELDKVAEKLVRIMARKAQLRQMQTRK